MYTEDVEMTENLPDDHYTEAEEEEIDTMFMGTESKARKRFQKNSLYRPRSLSRNSRYDGYRRQQSQYSGPRRDGNRDQSRSNPRTPQSPGTFFSLMYWV